jgi:uncharacterized membrane protein
MKTDQVAKALGWFSIGLGLAELIAPKRMAKATGLNKGASMMPLLGLREIASGIGILANQKPAGWVWSRVAGDAMDLAVLGAGFKSRQSDPTRLAIATAMVAGVTVADILCGKQLCEEQKDSRNGNATAEGAAGSHETFRTITINRSARELYQFWRNAENLQQIMPTLRSVKATGEKTSHWVDKGPGNVDVEWDSEIIEDNPADRISWRSLPGTKFPNSGSVRFEELPGDRGTVVRLKMICEAPAAGIGAKIAKVLGRAPQQQTMEFLRRFKQLMETGEIPTTQGQPAGRKSSLSPKFDVAARKMAEAH